MAKKAAASRGSKSAKKGGARRTTAKSARSSRSTGRKTAKKSAKKKTASKGSTGRGSAKRSLVDTGKARMFGKRRADGTFKEMDESGRSLSVDRRRTARKKTKSGYGDQGDRKRASKKR